MRILFISGRDVARGVSNQPFTYLAQARLLQALSLHADITLAAPLSPTREPRHDALLAPTVRTIELPQMHSIQAGTRRTLTVARILRTCSIHYDAALSLIPFPAPIALLAIRCPLILHFVGDTLQVVRTTTPKKPTRMIKLAPAILLDNYIRRCLEPRAALTVVNGFPRSSKGTPSISIVSSTLLDTEIDSYKRDRSYEPGAPFRILFVGYPRPEKGLQILLDVALSLHSEGKSIELRLILGNAGARKALRTALPAELLPVTKTLGHIPFGPDLFREYANADALVLPSLSEGTPRVLVEARAFRCPVIASAVGGVPKSVAHRVDGLLVPPGSRSSLKLAIEELMRNMPLRESLIQNGLSRARSTTITSMSTILYRELRHIVEDQSTPLSMHGF